MATPDFMQYPCQLPHLALELYDVTLYQRILNTPANFDDQSDVDVYEDRRGRRGKVEIASGFYTFSSLPDILTYNLLTSFRLVEES